MLVIQGKYANATVFTDTADSNTLGQVREICNQSYTKDARISIMPDCHAGAGCVVGTTMTIKDKIVPNLVGVDIGCGMLVTKLDMTVDLKALDEYIKREIPHGFDNNKTKKAIYPDMDKILATQHIKGNDYNMALGTLGGGNHFIEIDVDPTGQKYLVIHSGSRNFGLQVANLYQKFAFEHCKEIGDPLHKDIAYLSGKLMKEYLNDIHHVQLYAALNRETMARRITKQCLRSEFDDMEHFETIHNYINVNDMILRKGAVSAKTNEVLIIPINMRDGSLLCIGKGNEEWNFSAPHGAGRTMSRSEAKKKVFIEDYKKSMEGIYSTCINSNTIDESPMAYKPMEEIVNNIQDTVDINCVIKPIYNFKSGG